VHVAGQEEETAAAGELAIEALQDSREEEKDKGGNRED